MGLMNFAFWLSSIRFFGAAERPLLTLSEAFLSVMIKNTIIIGLITTLMRLEGDGYVTLGFSRKRLEKQVLMGMLLGSVMLVFGQVLVAPGTSRQWLAVGLLLEMAQETSGLCHCDVIALDHLRVTAGALELFASAQFSKVLEVIVPYAKEFQFADEFILDVAARSKT